MLLSGYQKHLQFLHSRRFWIRHRPAWLLLDPVPVHSRATPPTARLPETLCLRKCTVAPCAREGILGQRCLGLRSALPHLPFLLFSRHP